MSVFTAISTRPWSQQIEDLSGTITITAEVYKHSNIKRYDVSLTRWFFWFWSDCEQPLHSIVPRGKVAAVQLQMHLWSKKYLENSHLQYIFPWCLRSQELHDNLLLFYQGRIGRLCSAGCPKYLLIFLIDMFGCF